MGVPSILFFLGAAYDEQTECKLPAAHVLKVLGSVGIVFGLLFMFTFIIGRSDAIIVVYALSRFVKLILQIWGSILIFGKYFFLSKIPQYFKGQFLKNPQYVIGPQIVSAAFTT